MASPDDFLTTHKNGVIAINNLNQTLDSLYSKLSYAYGTTTSGGLSAATAVTTSPGRLVRIHVLVAGSATGFASNYATSPITTASGDGANVTVNFTGGVTFSPGDTVVVSGAVPAGINGSYTAGGGSGTNVVIFPNAIAAFGPSASPGTVFRKIVANDICAIPNTVGTYEVGAQFANGLYVSPGTGQSVAVTYSLD